MINELLLSDYFVVGQLSLFDLALHYHARQVVIVAYHSAIQHLAAVIKKPQCHLLQFRFFMSHLILGIQYICAVLQIEEHILGGILDGSDFEIDWSVFEFKV